MASGGGPQSDLRRRYGLLRPNWQPSAILYREMIRTAVTPSSRILEVGCGHKGFPVDTSAGSQHVGVDPDADAVKHNETLRFRAAARGERLPFAEGSFDFICSAWVLEHVDTPRAFMKEIHRVLAPGGRFAFVTPNGRNPVTWVIRAIPNGLHPTIMRRVQRRDVRDTYPVRYRINTPKTVERIMSETGFVREHLVLNGDPTYVALGPRSFRVAAAAERIFDIPALNGARIHLIGLYRRW
jgi:SAM-dependent methyltransferase